MAAAESNGEEQQLVSRFWGVVLSPGQTYTMTLSSAEIHITQAYAVGASSTNSNISSTSPDPLSCTLIVSSNRIKNIPVCTVTATPQEGSRQALLDLNFFEDDEQISLTNQSEKCSLSLVGTVAVYPLEDDEEEDEEEGEEEKDEEMPGLKLGKTEEEDEDEEEEKEEKVAAKPLTAAEKMKRKREESKSTVSLSSAKIAKVEEKEVTKSIAAPTPTPKPSDSKVTSSSDPKSPALKPLSASGKVQYHDFVVGTGKSPQSGKKVTVSYKGTLTNGKVFDESPNFSFRIGVGAVIRGWDEGVISMKEGGTRRLVIHPDYAYGAAGAPPTIPPNSILRFDVTLKRA